MRNHLKLADELHRKAMSELLKAKHNGMRDSDLVQAAEKGWLAAHRATNALLEHFGKKVTAGTEKKGAELIDLERRHPAIKQAAIYEKFWAFHSRLHVAAGYMDVVSSKLIERNLRAVGDYVETIRRLIA